MTRKRNWPSYRLRWLCEVGLAYWKEPRARGTDGMKSKVCGYPCSSKSTEESGPIVLDVIRKLRVDDFGHLRGDAAEVLRECRSTGNLQCPPRLESLQCMQNGVKGKSKEGRKRNISCSFVFLCEPMNLFIHLSAGSNFSFEEHSL